MTDETRLILPPGCFVVFVDDRGHEALVPSQPVYGLGGCAVMERDLECVIRQPWCEVRKAVTGSPDTPLHASTFSQSANRRDIEAVAEFFRRQPFARIGAIISISTTLLQELGPVPTIAKTLQNRVVEIARWTRFSDLKIIFESSDRADPLIKGAFQDFGLEEEGKPIPVDCYFMPKSAGEPALEVADSLCMRWAAKPARISRIVRDSCWTSRQYSIRSIGSWPASLRSMQSRNMRHVARPADACPHVANAEVLCADRAMNAPRDHHFMPAS